MSVTRLVQEIRRILEPPMSQVVVYGEVGNFSQHRSGNLYFTLKDGRTQIQCVMLAGVARKMAVSLCEGLQVVVKASVRIYPERGSLQLLVQALRLDGLGQLFAALEKLRQRLTAEGLFQESRKRPLPFLPRRVALVTSPQGAVLHDIWTTLRRRNPAVQLVLAPAAVQGAQAHADIIDALTRLQSLGPTIDCVIIARGGGSLEDLMPFNHEALIRFLSTYPLPIISAVGHETDYTLCDMVADRRAPTPTAAAEMVAPPRNQLLEQLSQLGARCRRALLQRLQQNKTELQRIREVTLRDYPRRRLERERERISAGKIRLLGLLPRRLERERLTLQKLKSSLAAFQPQRLLSSKREQLANLKKALEQAMSTRLERQHRSVESLKAQLGALSPRQVLNRGYALCLDENGKPITRAAQRRGLDPLEVCFLDGSLHCRVEEVSCGQESAGSTGTSSAPWCPPAQ